MIYISTLTVLAALVASHVALLTGLLLLATQHWHGHRSLDLSAGVQKFHLQPTMRVGGLAVVAGVLAGSSVAKAEAQALLWPLLLSGVPAFVFGLAEDITKQVSVRARLLATMACGVLGWALTGYAITDANLLGLDWLLGFTALSVLFTAFAVGGVANAINIIDGFNGLAAGTVIIILCSFALIAHGLDDAALKQTSLIIAGAVLGFGLLNWPMGKLFLGDGGAYFIGFAIAWLAVLLLARNPEVSAWAPLLVCAYPVLEVAFSMVRRRRRGLHPGHPDRLHLHSLVKRRVARKLLPTASNLVRNSTTGALMWGPALLPTLVAVNYPGHTPILVLGWLLSALLYSAIYARLTQFRWCFTAATLQPRPVKA